MANKDILKKITFVLNVIIVIFFLILVKVWHLSVLQKEQRLKAAIKPQRRTIIEKANRGTICDRNNNPLAINRIKYNASIYYSHIREIPSIRHIKENGKIIKKIHPRKEHIKKISHILAKELDIDPVRTEDLIHSKASIFPHIPFVVKENITEKEYYRLKMLEKDLIGLHAEITAERYYPYNELGANILGYLGRINQDEYFKIAQNINTLQNFIEKYENNEIDELMYGFENIDEIKVRLNDLKKLAYSINDLVGKTGIEKSLDEKLKGFHEKKTYAVDIQGNFLKEIPGSKKPKPGEKIRLTIIKELQAYAEELLAKDELLRDGQSKKYNAQKKEFISLKQPFIKGGAIVAMDPNNGEILALATSPSFNPNDFILSSNQNIIKTKNKNINKWLETQKHIANIFDGREKLSRKIFNKQHQIDEKELSYELFLDIILPYDSPIKDTLNKIKYIKNAILLQEDFEKLLFFSNESASNLIDFIFSDKKNNTLIKASNEAVQNKIKNNFETNNSIISPHKKRLVSYLSSIPHNKDKLFTLDILKTLVFNSAFSDELIEKMQNVTLSDYWKLTKVSLKIKESLITKIKPIFNEIYFSKWRKENEKDFLKNKRKIEQEKKQFARPFIDYLDQKENELFKEFWKSNENLFLTSFVKENKFIAFDELAPYLDFISKYKEKIEDTLLDEYYFLQNNLKDINFELTVNFFKTIREFDSLERPLYCKYPRIRKNKNIQMEKHLAASFYPKNGFGYSKSYAISNSSAPGSIFKLIPAYTALKERYDYLVNTHQSLIYLNPFTMIDDIYWDPNAKQNKTIAVGKTLDNKIIPRQYKKGRLPRSSHPNIGKINLISALERSSNPYFSILAGDYISDTKNLLKTAAEFSIGTKTGINIPGEKKGNLPEDILFNKTSLYSFAIGQHSLIVSPLQIAVMMSAIANKGKVLIPQIVKDEDIQTKNAFFIPKEIRTMLLEGMDLVVSGEKGSARPIAITKLIGKPTLMNDYKNLFHQFVGKTSTAEFMCNLDMTPSEKAKKYKNIWFGAISFKKPQENKPVSKKQIWEKPELVVVVELNFGSSGKEAAPLAAQMVKKYRELKEKY